MKNSVPHPDDLTQPLNEHETQELARLEAGARTIVSNSRYRLDGHIERLRDALMEAQLECQAQRLLSGRKALGSKNQAHSLVAALKKVEAYLRDPHVRNRLRLADKEVPKMVEVGEDIKFQFPIPVPSWMTLLVVTHFRQLAERAATFDGRKVNGDPHDDLRDALVPLLHFWTEIAGHEASKTWEWGDKESALVSFLSECLSLIEEAEITPRMVVTLVTGK